MKNKRNTPLPVNRETNLDEITMSFPSLINLAILTNPGKWVLSASMVINISPLLLPKADLKTGINCFQPILHLFVNYQLTWRKPAGTNNFRCPVYTPVINNVDFML